MFLNLNYFKSNLIYYYYSSSSLTIINSKTKQKLDEQENIQSRSSTRSSNSCVVIEPPEQHDQNQKDYKIVKSLVSPDKNCNTVVKFPSTSTTTTKTKKIPPKLVIGDESFDLDEYDITTLPLQQLESPSTTINCDLNKHTINPKQQQSFFSLSSSSFSNDHDHKFRKRSGSAEARSSSTSTRNSSFRRRLSGCFCKQDSEQYDHDQDNHKQWLIICNDDSQTNHPLVISKTLKVNSNQNNCDSDYSDDEKDDGDHHCQYKESWYKKAANKISVVKNISKRSLSEERKIFNEQENVSRSNSGLIFYDNERWFDDPHYVHDFYYSCVNDDNKAAAISSAPASTTTIITTASSFLSPLSVSFYSYSSTSAHPSIYPHSYYHHQPHHYHSHHNYTSVISSCSDSNLTDIFYNNNNRTGSIRISAGGGGGSGPSSTGIRISSSESFNHQGGRGVGLGSGLKQQQQKQIVGSAESLVGRVLQEQGLGKYLDPAVVRAAQKELAESLNMTQEGE